MVELTLAEGHVIEESEQQSVVDEAAAQFSKAEPLLVCCADGMRSKSASTQLADAGFESVSFLDGGTREWLAEEYDLKYSDTEGEEDDYRWT